MGLEAYQQWEAGFTLSWLSTTGFYTLSLLSTTGFYTLSWLSTTGFYTLSWLSTTGFYTLSWLSTTGLYIYIVMSFYNRVFYIVMTFYNRDHLPGWVMTLQQGSFTRLGLYATLLSSVEEISTSVGRINSSVSQTIWMVELQATGRSNTHCFMAMLASCCIMLKVSLMLRKMAKKYCNTRICYRVM